VETRTSAGGRVTDELEWAPWPNAGTGQRDCDLHRFSRRPGIDVTPLTLLTVSVAVNLLLVIAALAIFIRWICWLAAP
jgi:hypothetical protein